MRPLFLDLAFLLVLFLAAGCGGSSGPPEPEGPRGTVTGEVKYNGSAITEGTLTLDSGKGYILGARINSDGTFELFGPKGREVVAGTYKVGVNPSLVPTPVLGGKAEAPPKTSGGLPEKFYNPLTSGVTVEIEEGEQEITIDLK